jgi:hypothetical protein
LNGTADIAATCKSGTRDLDDSRNTRSKAAQAARAPLQHTREEEETKEPDTSLLPVMLA